MLLIIGYQFRWIEASLQDEGIRSGERDVPTGCGGLYRNRSSGTYYALVKRGSKQIRRSLKTKDRKLADRRLADFRREAGMARAESAERRLTFAQLGEQWLMIAAFWGHPVVWWPTRGAATDWRSSSATVWANRPVNHGQ